MKKRQPARLRKGLREVSVTDPFGNRLHFFEEMEIASAGRSRKGDWLPADVHPLVDAASFAQNRW